MEERETDSDLVKHGGAEKGARRLKANAASAGRGRKPESVMIQMRRTAAAGMAELVDARDLKSLEPCAREGSIPSPGTKNQSLSRFAPMGGEVPWVKNMGEFSVF